MASKNYKYFFPAVLLAFLSCSYVDIGGLFYSSRVEERFLQKNDLKNFAAPDVSDDADFSFLVITDTHYYLEDPHFIRDIEKKRKDWGISFIIICGDIVQNGYPSAYKLAKEDIARSKVPVYTVIGNHDIYNNGWEVYKKKIGRSVYAFGIGDTYFIFLDTANGTLGDHQKGWLENRLKGSDRYKHKMIFTHYGIASPVMQEGMEFSSQEERYYLYDLFDRYGADIVFSGHLHYNDKKTIRGVIYQVLNNINEFENDSYLKVTVKGSKLTYRIF